MAPAEVRPQAEAPLVVRAQVPRRRPVVVVPAQARLQHQRVEVELAQAPPRRPQAQVAEPAEVQRRRHPPHLLFPAARTRFRSNRRSA